MDFNALMSDADMDPRADHELTDSKLDKIEVSVVIPAMNEVDTLATLHQRIAETCRGANIVHEVILVDDGSDDGTWSEMIRLADSEPHTSAVRLRRNFGKAAALSAGFDAARGELVVTMDADLQDDPEEIPAFVRAIRQGRDVVSGWKKIRHDPWHKTLPSRAFNTLVNGFTGLTLHDHNCGFKAYRSEVLKELDLYGERHRFVPVLAAARGFRVGEIEVKHHPRRFGKSKYGVSRLAKGTLDLLSVYLLTGYGRRPFHLIGSAGLACFGIGAVGMMFLSFRWVTSRLGDGEPLHLHSTAIFYYCILAVLLGAQCFLAGLLAELVVSISAASERNARRQDATHSSSTYSIADQSIWSSQNA